MTDNRTPADTLIQNIANALADQAADTLEPLAGAAITDAQRERIAVALRRALRESLPPLCNLRNAVP